MWLTLRDYVIGFVLITILILSGLFAYEKHSAAKARGLAKVAVQTSQKLSQELTEAHQSYRVDLDAINANVEQKIDIVATTKKIEEKVNAVSKQVEVHQVSDADADTVYVASMWEAYCKGSSDPACSTRQSSTADTARPAPTSSK
jgi:hypothetical protein